MKIEIDPTRIHARAYKRTQKGIYFVKVDFPDVGMFINSITVRPSIKNPGEMWVQPPQFPPSKGKKKWITPIEFSGASELWGLIEDAALRAVDGFSHESLDDTVPDETKSTNDIVSTALSVFPGAEVLPIKPKRSI